MEILKTEKGFLSILAGKTDMGKSTISVLNCAEHLKKGENVIFFSLEYNQSIIYYKLVNHFDLKFNELINLNVVDSRELPLKEIENIIYNRKKEVDIVYIDYLDLLRDNTYNRENSRKKELDPDRLPELQEIIAKLAEMAQELNISIVLLSQLKDNLTLENIVENINLVTSTVNTKNKVIKMFIGRDETLNPLIKCNDMSHIILIDGYNLMHFSSVNLKEAYKFWW